MSFKKLVQSIKTDNRVVIDLTNNLPSIPLPYKAHIDHYLREVLFRLNVIKETRHITSQNNKLYTALNNPVKKMGIMDTLLTTLNLEDLETAGEEGITVAIEVMADTFICRIYVKELNLNTTGLDLIGIWGVLTKLMGTICGYKDIVLEISYESSIVTDTSVKQPALITIGFTEQRSSIFDLTEDECYIYKVT